MMKPKKLIGNILMVLGSVVLLVSLLAMYLPTVPNRQTQLIVASFQKPSSNGLIQLMNNGMNFAMNNGFLLLLIGFGIVAGGILLIILSRNDISVVKQKTTKAAPTAANRPVVQQNQPFTPKVAPAQPVESNPFARYMKDGSLPKSTVSVDKPQASQQTASHITGANEAEDSRDDILNIWNKIQEQPEDTEELYIQPVHVEDDEAYRRPEDSSDEVDTVEALNVEEEAHPLLDEALESQPAGAAEATPAEEPIFPPAFDDIPKGNDIKPVSESSTDKPRPVIRSTFRKSTADQPAQETVLPEETQLPLEAIDQAIIHETAMEDALAQPTSRIKSTMGRKR